LRYRTHAPKQNASTLLPSWSDWHIAVVSIVRIHCQTHSQHDFHGKHLYTYAEVSRVIMFSHLELKFYNMTSPTFTVHCTGYFPSSPSLRMTESEEGTEVVAFLMQALALLITPTRLYKTNGFPQCGSLQQNHSSSLPAIGKCQTVDPSSFVLFCISRLKKSAGLNPISECVHTPSTKAAKL
jgi:hypothetical protein